MVVFRDAWTFNALLWGVQSEETSFGYWFDLQ